MGFPLQREASRVQKLIGALRVIPNAKYTNDLLLSTIDCRKGGRGLAANYASIGNSGKQGARVAPNKNRPHPTLS